MLYICPTYITASQESNDNIVLVPATPTDMTNVFHLSNNKAVRANSFNSQPIKLAEHKAWFAQKLRDRNSLILIAKHGGQFVGQIRFDIKDNVATGGISLDPKFRGKGLASVILLQGINYLHSAKPQVKVIIAYIKPQNTPSIKLFEKNGFVFVKQTTINKQDAVEYQLNLES